MYSKQTFRKCQSIFTNVECILKKWFAFILEIYNVYENVDIKTYISKNVTHVLEKC